MSIGLFAFAKGVADAEEDLYITKRKAKAKQAEREAEQAAEDAASRYTLQYRGQDIMRFDTRRNDSSDDTRRASGFALSNEIAELMKESTFILDNKEKTKEDGSPMFGPQEIQLAQTTVDLLRSDEAQSQINSWTSMAFQDITKLDQIGENEFAYQDWRSKLPHAIYFDKEAARLDKITGAGYKFNDDPEHIWNTYNQLTNNGAQTGNVEADNAGPTSIEENRRNFLRNYNRYLKSGKDRNAELGYYQATVDSFIESDLDNNLDSLILLTSGNYPKRTAPEGKIPGYTMSRVIDQTKDADIDKKAPIIISTNETIAQLTYDMQGLMIGMYNEAKASGDIDKYIQGALPRFISNVADVFFGPAGAIQNLPTFTNMIAEKTGSEFLGGKKIKYGDKEYTFDQFVNEGIEIKNQKMSDEFGGGSYDPYALDYDGRFKKYMDGKGGKLSTKEAFDILEAAKTEEGYDAWKNTIGFAGLFAAKEIALAFNVAIMRQGFEGGKAVSDPDFQRSYDEVRAGGGILGVENMSTKIKYFSILRNEMADKALPAIIFSRSKSGVLPGQTLKHAAASLMNDLVPIINSANDTPMYDLEGNPIPMPLVGRQIPLALTLTPELFKSLMEFEKNEYTSWINSENDVEVRKTEEVINKATKKEDNTITVGSLFDSLEKQATESGL
jgi:hypothetical protein